MATPKKSVSFLSPSVKNVCFTCQKTMSLEEKRNLWKEGKKSDALLIEGLLRITISNIDFGAICRGCFRLFSENGEYFQEGRGYKETSRGWKRTCPKFHQKKMEKRQKSSKFSIEK